MKTIYHLAISRLKYNKGRSILTIVAIALMTTLLMSIGSSALTVIRHQQLEIKESARNYHAAFKGSTADQVFILENHADVESLSLCFRPGSDRRCRYSGTRAAAATRWLPPKFLRTRTPRSSAWHFFR